MNNPFEDSREEFEDSTVNLKEGKDRGRASLSKKPISLSKKV